MVRTMITEEFLKVKEIIGNGLTLDRAAKIFEKCGKFCQILMLVAVRRALMVVKSCNHPCCTTSSVSRRPHDWLVVYGLFVVIDEHDLKYSRHIEGGRYGKVFMRKVDSVPNKQFPTCQ